MLVMIILVITLILLAIWIVVSTAVLIYFYFHPEVGSAWSDRHPSLTNWWALSTFLFMVIVLDKGVTALVFVPRRWGWHDDEGEWITLKDKVGLFLAIGLALLLLKMLSVPSRLRSERQALTDRLESALARIEELETQLRKKESAGRG